MEPLPPLGELETAVLEHLWLRGTAEAKDVHRILGDPRGITLTTIQSTLERLHRKRLLLREKFGYAYRYAPAISRESFLARAMASVGGRLQGAAAAGVLAAFVDLAVDADDENLDRLDAIIAAARNRREGT